MKGEEVRPSLIRNTLAEDLFYGTSVSDCLLPCVRTTARVEDKVMMVQLDHCQSPLSQKCEGEAELSGQVKLHGVFPLLWVR